jgi:hypothetical protein
MVATMNTASPIAVLDTNVFLDVHSCHDLTETYAKLGPAAINDLSVVYRRARARESLLVAIYFNKIKATTFGLHFEMIELLTGRAPPTPVRGVSFEAEFASVFTWFVKDHVLPDWTPAVPTEPGNERGNGADRVLIATAKEHNVPLITNEGYGQTGIVDEKMRKLAKDSGVRVFAPREFYRGKIDEAVEIARFLQRFDERAPLYLDAHWRKHGHDKSGELLGIVNGYYRHILLGETQDPNAPVRVAV